ncbi:restriction endonuclease subunit S [Candidatus Venteria ishoeyi]|uniref:Type I restriction modification DNA specificity domain protein n=1 Tax=Candidatus Venteria ishoeyi TaxID=1899563 RepID=A0A1H6F834_9GAMM|nr:restriction endonuclease subunit S [Candidatus Venteria ishoeyi]SEH06297.1 Type I restriction modification DNA specificity domain protein [Candidatus Venteria ishoeyi]
MAKLKAYDNYKQVEYDYVSQLPVDWELLPNIAIFQERIERGYIEEELLSVTIGKGVIRQAELDKKDSSTLDKSKYLLVHSGDLVYSMRFRQGASGYSIYKGIVSPACTVLRPKRNITINPKYFYYMFRSGFYKNYVERFAYGIADGQIPLRYTHFKRMYSIVPPLKTQNAIVAYLDRKTSKIQEFIHKKERLVKLLEEKINFLVNDDSNWKQEKAKWIFEDITIKNKIDEQLLAVTQDRGVLPKSMCNENFVSPTSFEGLKLVVKNDFVISLRSFQGGIEHSKYQGIVSAAYNIIRLLPEYDNEKNTLFFKYYFKSPKLISLLNTVISGIRDGQNIHWSDFKNIVLPLPDKSVIKIVLDNILTFEKLKNRLHKEKDILKEFEESLITQVVTGQLKVPDATNKEAH